MEKEILIFFERQNNFVSVKPSQLSRVTWEMKSKEVMFPSSSSTTHFQVASQSSNLRGAARMRSPSMRSTVPAHLICHHIFHPQSLFFITKPGAHFCSYSENTASPYIHNVCMCPIYFTEFRKNWNRLQSPSPPPQGAVGSILGLNS